MKLLSQGKTVLSASVRLLLKPHILPCKPSPTVHFLFTFSFTFGPFLWNRKFTLCFPLRDKFYIDTGWSVLCFFFLLLNTKGFYIEVACAMCCFCDVMMEVAGSQPSRGGKKKKESLLAEESGRRIYLFRKCFKTPFGYSHVAKLTVFVLYVTAWPIILILWRSVAKHVALQYFYTETI